MRIRTILAGALTALTLTACSSGGDDDSSSTDTPSASPSVDMSDAVKAAGIPPEPTGQPRTDLLKALAAINPAIVTHEDKAIDAARNQCGAINGGAQRLDQSASVRFTYRDVTTTEAQGKQINEALMASGFCKV